MIPTDILPTRIAPPGNSGPVRAAPQKDNDASERGDSADFPHMLKKVAGDKEQPASVQERTARPQDMMLARWQRLEAAEPGAGDHAAADAAQAGDEEPKDEGRIDDDTGGDAVKPDVADAMLTQGPGVPLHAGAHDVLSLLLARNRLSASDHQSKSVPADRAKSAEETKGLDANATATVRNVKIVSVKVETHFARASTEAVSADVAHHLAALNRVDAGPQAKTVGPVAVKPATAAAAEGEVTGKEQGADAVGQFKGVRGQRLPDRETGQRGLDALGRGGRETGDDAAVGTGAAASGENAAATTIGSADNAAQPSTVGSPMQQLGGRLAAVAHEMHAVGAATGTPARTDPAAAPAGPIRVLSIDLHPGELGSVTVRMSLVGEGLDVQIEAERPETARLLRSDSGALSDMLRTAGVQVDGVSVRAAQMDGVAGNTGTSQSFMDQQSQSQSGGAQPDARASGGNGREQDAQAFAQQRQEPGASSEERPQRSGGRGLYV